MSICTHNNKSVAILAQAMAAALTRTPPATRDAREFFRLCAALCARGQLADALPSSAIVMASSTQIRYPSTAFPRSTAFAPAPTQRDVLRHARCLFLHGKEGNEKHQVLEEARIAALYKKGDPEKPENYRPLSFLNTLFKLMAAIMKRRTEDEVEHVMGETQFVS